MTSNYQSGETVGTNAHPLQPRRMVSAVPRPPRGWRRGIAAAIVGVAGVAGLLGATLAGFPGMDGQATHVWGLGFGLVVGSLAAFLLRGTVFKALEDYLGRTEEFHRQLAETSIDAVLLLNDRQSVVSINEAAERIFQGSTADLVGRDFDEMMDDTKERDLATGVPQLITLVGRVTMKRLTQERFPAEVKMTKVRMPGNRSMVVAVVRDLSALERVETENERNRALVERLFAAHPDALAYKDERGLYRMANPAYCRWLGRSALEVLRQSDRNLLPPEEADREQRDDQFTINAGTTQVFERQRRGDGQKGVRHYQIIRTPLPLSDQPDSSGVLVSVRDITKLKEIELRLRENQERLKLIFRCNPSPMVLSDALSGRIVAVNDAFTRLVGLTEAQASGRSLEDLGLDPQTMVPEEQAGGSRQDPRVTGSDTTALNNDMFTFRPGTLRTARGELMPIGVSHARFQAGNQTWWLTVLADTTPQRQLERSKNDAQREQRELRREWAMLVGGLALRGLAELRDLALRVPQAQSPDLLRRLEDVLDLSQLFRQTESRLVFQPFDPQRLPAQILAHLEGCSTPTPRTPLPIQVTSTIAPHIQCELDTNRLVRILAALVEELTPWTIHHRSISIEVAIVSDPVLEKGRRDTSRSFQSVRVTFVVAIKPPSDQIEAPYHSTTPFPPPPKAGDLGLGFLIAQGFVEALRGRWWMESDAFAGPSIRFELHGRIVERSEIEFGTELAVASACDLPTVTSAPHTTRPVAPLGPARPRVLLVTPRAMSGCELAARLSELGCDVLTTSQGEDGLRLWRQRRFDLVLIDLDLLAPDPVTVVRRIRREEAIFHQVPLVIGLTYDSSDHLDTLAKESGFDALVRLPLGRAVLNHRLVEPTRRWMLQHRASPSPSPPLPLNPLPPFSKTDSPAASFGSKPPTH